MSRSQNTEEEIFKAALKLDTPEERAVYLKDACQGDEALRSRVEDLLKAHDAAAQDGFLDGPPLDPGVTRISEPVREGPGTVIGRYKLLEKIGEGGMAVVYMAEQERPVRRKVALKIIKLGMDTKQVIARFEAERQALALMDHPHIAKVFDGGATGTGRPYFVMELVRGIPITDYSDQNRLDTRQRLQLFIQVCQAVQHAHQKGIIHRDIKPTNVLVTQRDGMAVPKVIDFGIAKAINQRLTEKTLFTCFAQMIGTPQYMSPEQAEMNELDVDTRTDVYSLGVLLYQVLVGATPFDVEQLRQVGYHGIQRILRDTEPLKPSTKLTALGDTLSAVAQSRKATPESLARLVSGDLDWIVMKTLEKDRTRRYETAHALAQDIKRHLANETILAGRPTILQRGRKFVCRNRAVVAGVAAVLVVLCTGIVVSTCFAVGQMRAWNRFKAVEEERRVLENEQRLSTARRLYDSGHFRDALTEVDLYMKQGTATADIRLFHARLLFSLNRLEEAEGELDALVTEPPEMAAAAYHLLAGIHASDRSHRARDLRRIGEQLRTNTMGVPSPRTTAAQTAVDTIRWASEALALQPGDFPVRQARARAYYEIKDLPAMAQDAEILIVLRPEESVGYTLRAIARRDQGLYPEALEDHERAIQLCDAKGSQAELYDQRRMTLALAGDFRGAMQDAKRCLNLDPDRRDYHFNSVATRISGADYEGAIKDFGAVVDYDPWCGKEFLDRTWKYVFHALGTAQPVDLPESLLHNPLLDNMQGAVEAYRALSTKAKRRVPDAGPRMSWSPDGTKLAYSRAALFASELSTLKASVPVRPLSSGIEILDLETGRTRLLVPFGMDPAWSADGQWIAFAHRSSPGVVASEAIYIVNISGRSPRRLALGSWPAWTSDTQHVYFQRRPHGVLCWIDIAHDDAIPEEIMACPDGFPALSWDGQRLAYRENDRICLVDLPSRRVLKYITAPGPPRMFQLTLSPSGEEICLGTDQANNLGLWIFNTETEEIRCVFDSPVSRGVWSPNHTSMALLVSLPYGDEIWVAALEPNETTCAALAPTRTWKDYIRNQCERGRSLVARCPANAEAYLADLYSLGTGEFRAGQFEHAALVLGTVVALRHSLPGKEWRPRELSLLTRALYVTKQQQKADVNLLQLRQLFRRGTFVQGHQALMAAERARADYDRRLNSVWSDIDSGFLQEGAAKLDRLQLQYAHDKVLKTSLDGLRCLLAMGCYYHALGLPGGQAECTDAVRYLETAVHIDPNYTPALSCLVLKHLLKKDAGDPDTKRVVEYAVRACEQTHWESARYLAIAALAYVHDGLFVEAVRCQRKAVEVNADRNGVFQEEHQRLLSLCASEQVPTPAQVQFLDEILVAATNCGGKAAENFTMDDHYAGGTRGYTGMPVDMSCGLAPVHVYQTVRYGRAFAYTFSGLYPNAVYSVRLHFNELYAQQSVGSIFDVLANGRVVLDDYDVLTKAEGVYKAITEDVRVKADATGTVVFSFRQEIAVGQCCGIEVFE